MEIETDLPHRDGPGRSEQVLEGLQVPILVEVLRLVRVQPHGRVEPFVLLRHVDGEPGVFERRPRNEDPFHSRRERPRDDFPTLGGREHLHVAVRVADHFTRVPGGTSASGTRITGSPLSASDAASTIPSDSSPMSLAGCRLATTTTVFPTSASAA